ncbi:class II glutamine amidotransferase [Streptomyces subrutilus]|uniref:Class II glutamine amidotransferase n=1 Tax=Streptomyces subrutilus TaxID=36818 RepID=A0A5P2UIR6_9ACTN|nr:class II glutamine amidotransferase [Streptomyces subrutilus]QEU77611.1 class II glutamine amidotransferase [Streptomyces subrutilus]WSJ33294.1 class II glutamine amidotransferase [Streptomyces subrutilus]GGZ64630.1 class II glutamine amidotransferase [Streptomyces subrutilus]
MCRWLAYSGTPLLLDTVLYKPQHSLIDQSLHSRMGVETTNGDGFGVGWYTEDGRETPTPAIMCDVGPAWNNRNLHEIADHVRSGLFFAHIRASTGTAVQQSNCHPFRHGRWMWMHNGAIAGFHEMRRELCLLVDPVLFPDIGGTTDSEVMFYLALTYGLDDDPPAAVARMVGVVERVGREHGVEFPMQMTVAVTDGVRVWAFRYSSSGASRSLFYSSRVDSLRRLHPDKAFLRDVSEETRLVVSEPLGDLPGAWHEVPESTYGIVQPGADELLPFVPQPA